MSPLSMFDKTKKDPPTCSALIAAAGSSQRCKGEDKLLFDINGKPVVAHTIEAFQSCRPVDEIIVVVREEQLEMFADICSKYEFTKVSKIIVGGETRTESVLNGIFALPGKAKYVAIHDGSRPCITHELIEMTLRKALKYHAAAPAVPIISTIKRLDGEAIGDYGPVISETVDRNGLYEIQTPQIFKAEIIKAALTKAVTKSYALTDDCMAVEMLGMPVHTVPGDRRNIKITEIGDLEMAKALLNYELGIRS